MIVCLAANPSIDKLFEIDRLEPGAIHRPSGFVQVAGGKGLNVARAASALGAEVTVVALLRGHSGKWIEEALAAEGVRGRFVWEHGENRAALSVADRKTRGLTEFYENGSEVSSSSWPELAHAVEQAMKDASWLAVSGSVPEGIPPDAYGEMIPPAHASGVKVAIDSHGELFASALSAGPDFVKCNAAEASESLGSPVESVEQAAGAASEFRRAAGESDRAAVVTLGKSGAVLAASGGAMLHGKVEADGSYPVGSGDAFLAGYVAAMDAGSGDEEAFRLALGASAANAEIAGAGRLERARAETLAAQAILVEI